MELLLAFVSLVSFLGRTTRTTTTRAFSPLRFAKTSATWRQQGIVPSLLSLYPKGFESSSSHNTSTTKKKTNQKRKQKTTTTTLFPTTTRNKDSNNDHDNAIYRRDYQPPAYRTPFVEMNVNILNHDHIVITTTLTIVASSFIQEEEQDLILDGDARCLNLHKVLIFEDDDSSWQQLLPNVDYTVTNDSLVILKQLLKSNNTTKLQTVVHHDDYFETKQELEGLVQSKDGVLFTHCEPRGFRQVTYFVDRPDNTACFQVRIEASQTDYEILLSNGNCIESGTLLLEKDENRHYVVFDDPYPKPSYSFALVAAPTSKLTNCLCGTYTTKSGRTVDLNIYSDAPSPSRMKFAMQTLKETLQWDEETYGFEYDLNVYNIVAIQEFTLGAMENKGLNLFLTSLIATDPTSSTTTDVTLDIVQKTVAHEVLHNWSGNRVTLQNWFEFGLKEGLTVFRDQEFMASHHQGVVTRIEAVKILRETQFAPARESRNAVRPEKCVHYSTSSNKMLDELASPTAYHKGAEVCRMLQTILGKEGFRKGLQLYMKRHDGTGATWDDFTRCMAAANLVNLDQFALWYSTGGSPTVLYKFIYNDENKTATLRLTQRLESSAEVLLHIPIAVGFLDKDTGKEVVPTTTLQLKKRSETYEFSGLENNVVPSILRDFSAPVILIPEDDQTQRQQDKDLSFLATYDTDGYNKWEAIQKLYSLCIFKLIRDEDVQDVKHGVFEAFGHTLRDLDVDPASKAAMLCLPTKIVLARQLKVENPGGVHRARQDLGKLIHGKFKFEIHKMYEELSASIPTTTDKVQTDTRSRAVRALRNILLDYLCFADSGEEQDTAAVLAMQHLDSACCLTDKLSAFRKLSSMSGSVTVETMRDEATEKFYQYAKQQNDPIVMNKWFQTQALSDLPDVLERVQKLTQHPDFKATNAGRFRSLITSFTMNSRAFHCESGYKFIGSVTTQMDRVAPQLAVELANKFSTWHRHRPELAELMRSELTRIGSVKPISKSLSLAVQRALAEDK